MASLNYSSHPQAVGPEQGIPLLQGSNDRIVDQFLTNQDPNRNLGALISRHPLLTRAALAQSSGSGGLTCVHTLVAGAGSLQQTMARTRVMSFRSAQTLPV